ncbi:GNAT family N-acetyltransferase [Candidatus Daviesbacteria bacterium]|nr:GNAT family N-acetyltransferase [Candidatus Daviesbacteria bacterium]
MLVKKMSIKNFNSIHNLWKEAGLSIPEIQKEKEEAKLILRLNSSSSFEAYNKGKLAGTILGIFNGRRGWIYHLAVHPDFQKKGIGSLLLQKAEEALKKLGAKRILLWVRKDNLGVTNFYQKHGYFSVEDAIVLGKDLI